MLHNCMEEVNTKYVSLLQKLFNSINGPTEYTFINEERELSGALDTECYVHVNTKAQDCITHIHHHLTRK